MKIAIYPGSFDPITNGHIDILERALSIFDEVIVLLAVNPAKATTFTASERLTMIKGAVARFGTRVKVDMTTGLSVRYAKDHGACALVRGLRAVPDFEFEYQIAAGNEFIDKNIEMVFFMSRRHQSFISSSTIKGLAEHQIDISTLVPVNVNEYLKKRYAK